MKKILILICFSAVTSVFWFSCSKKTEKGTSVEVVDGIEHVHNGEAPMFPDRTVAFEEELVIRSEDEEGNITLFRPGWYVVDEQEHIYIADRQDLAIKVFDPEGRLTRVLGQKGRGPGEFQHLGRILLLPDSRLLVSDWEEKRISLFYRDGRFISSHKMRASSYDIYLCAESFYAREEMTIEPDGTEWGFKRSLSVKAFDYNGNEVFSYGEFQASQSAFVQGRFSFSKPYDVHSVLAGDQKNRRLYHCLSDKYIIEVFDHEGRLTRKIDRPYERFPVTEQDKERYLDGFRARGSSEEDVALIEKHAMMPKWKPVTKRMIVDDSGNLWVELNEKKEENDRIFTAYDIISEDGVYEAKVWSDVSIGLIRKGKMYTRETDEETGYNIYNRYRIIWSNRE